MWTTWTTKKTNYIDLSSNVVIYAEMEGDSK